MPCKPTGFSNAHIKQSQGADTNIMKFYITQNSSTYGNRFEKFQPRPGKHTGTGYQSNFRPAVYYNRRLDDVDNPAMRRICDGNYRTVTQLDFRPYRDSSGLDAFPRALHQAGSGFINNKGNTLPITQQVKGVFIDTRAASAPSNILPRHKPLLHKLGKKDPIEQENQGYGPSYMITETHEKFKKNLRPCDLSMKELGPNSMSGFVHNDTNDPITREPKYAHKNEMPGWHTQRPTGISTMKTSYVPKDWLRGDELLPGGVANGSERGTGFTREEFKPKYVNLKAPDAYDKLSEMPSLRAERICRTDPTECINMRNPHNKSSVSREIYKGQQRPSPSEADRLNSTGVGFKEDTGFVENNTRFVQTSDDKMRFLTHYMTRFGVDPNPIGVERAGHMSGGIQRQKSDGFTKSTEVNTFGKDVSSSQVLHRVEPYVGRSIRAKNVFFDDHTHDSKMRTGIAT